MAALKDIPTVNRPLQTQRGDAILQKTDIFKKMMWFGYRGDNNWYPVPVARVQEILEENAAGKAVEMLVPQAAEEPKQNEFVAQVEGNLERLDDKFRNKKKKKKSRRPAEDATPQQTAATDGTVPNSNRPISRPDQAQRPHGQRPVRNLNRSNRPGDEVKENREAKPPHMRKEGGTEKPAGKPQAVAPQEGQDQQKKRPKKPFRGRKPDQNKPPRTDV